MLINSLNLQLSLSCKNEILRSWSLCWTKWMYFFRMRRGRF